MDLMLHGEKNLNGMDIQSGQWSVVSEGVGLWN